MRSVLEQMRNCLSSDPWMHTSIKTPRCMHACMYSCIHDLSIINMLYAVKKIVTLNPYLPSPPLQPKVAIVERFDWILVFWFYHKPPLYRILTPMQGYLLQCSCLFLQEVFSSAKVCCLYIAVGWKEENTCRLNWRNWNKGLDPSVIIKFGHKCNKGGICKSLPNNQTGNTPTTNYDQ